jgi:hypothetical protein
LLDPDQQKAVAPEFLSYIDEVERMAEERLTAIGEAITETSGEMMSQVSAKLDEIVEKISGAGASFEAGANTIANTAAQGIGVDVRVYDGRIDYAVNG